MVKKEFEVDDILYVVKFDENTFSLYVNGLKSKKQTSKIDYDEFDSFDSDDGPVKQVFYRSNLVKAKNPMKVYVNAVKFVESIVGKRKPYYLTYTANEKKKVHLYNSVAEKIANKYGYNLLIEEKKFKFFRKTIEI